MGRESTLYVYSSHRSLMQNSNEGEIFAPSMMMGDFFTQLIIIDGYRALPRGMRLPLVMSVLKECAKELERAKFIFEKSFLGFLETSNFLFDFFDEIAQSQIHIKDIPSRDIYDDYADHLYVLEWLENRYKERLFELKCYDGYILPAQAQPRFNEAFVRHFECIEIFVEGIISPIHQEMLLNAAKIIPIKVHFWVDEFNISLPFLPSHILKQCKPFFRYSAELDTGKIIQFTPLPPLGKIDAYGFALGISQVALVFAKIDEWIKNGVQEQDIVVIVPNENFAKYLFLLDRAHNLNFAMGEDISRTKVYKYLQDYIHSQLKNITHIPQTYAQVCKDIIAMLAGFEDRQSKRVREYVSEILFMWENVGLKETTHMEIIELLLEELKHYSIDDIMGGKIRVMGVLESRGFAFKKAVIVDFNEGVIPSKQESDLFLNSALRQKLKMPTMRDKERLQKHYYYGIFSTADEIAVAYVSNEDNHPSFMLEELMQKSAVEHKNGDNLFTLLPQGRKLEYCEDEISGRLPRTLTPSKLKVFLECPRRYYYLYEECMNDLSLFQESVSMGNIVHQCLESVYKPYVGKKVILDEKTLYKSAQLWLEHSLVSHSALQSAHIEWLKCELKHFFALENGREVEILQLEGENMEVSYGDFIFYGRPDRIQKVGESIEVIDYKYRQSFKVQSLQKSTDFALILYMQAFKAHYPQYAHLAISAWYWDIKGGEKKEENNEKSNILFEKIACIKDNVVFAKSEQRSNCRYCEFIDLCDRS